MVCILQESSIDKMQGEKKSDRDLKIHQKKKNYLFCNYCILCLKNNHWKVFFLVLYYTFSFYE